MDDRIARVLALAAAAGYECEAFCESGERFQVEVYKGKVESIDRSKDEGVGIRLLRDGRMGHSFSNESGPGGMDSLFEEARLNAEVSTPLDVDILGSDTGFPAGEETFAEVETAGDPDARIKSVMEMERAAFDFDGSIENTEGAGYSEVSGEVRIASTRGFYRRERRRRCSCTLAAVARRGDEIRSGWYYSQARDVGMLDFRGTGMEAARRALSALGSSPIPTGRYPVVFDATAFIDIVYLLEQALSGEMVVKGTTVFAGRVGEKIAAGMVTLVDDPFLGKGCFNSRFDDEGVPRERYVLIDRGTLNGFLHNTWSAAKTRSRVTANAVRESYKELPVPGPSNLFILPGNGSIENLMAEASGGIYVQNIMGMHTADPISGDFSVGINGLCIESGLTGKAFSEMTISGNILDLLAHIRNVGSEIVFIGPYGSPPVLIDGMSVSGI